MKLCMGCMKQIEDNQNVCPYCGFNESTLRQESYYLTPGTIVGGKYIVGKVLNYGGYTISYLGMDAEKQRKVIVKEYLPSDFSTRSEGEKEITIYSGDAKEQFEEGLTNFLNEANQIQQLGEVEGIATVYDCIAENDTGYVVSEYLEGQTLKEILDSGKKYSAAEAKRFVSKILKGLCKVHPLGIIHCDISPETIMVTETGEIKLLDFGATRYVTTANSKSLAIILKQGYAPEEQYRSKGIRGPWTDVYAVAAVMYRMMTGVVPQESVERALSDEVKVPSKLGVKIPESGENALMNALNVYQEDRTPSAEAFLNELNSKKVERIRSKKKRVELGRLSKWTKVMVACLACVVLAGGAFLLKVLNDNAGNVEEQKIVMEDLTGQKLDDVEKYVSNINTKKGKKIERHYTTVYNADKDKNNTIKSQTIKKGTDIKDISEISFEVYSNEIIRYDEIRGMNAYELAMKIGKDAIEKLDAKKDKSEKHNYYDLVSILTDERKISVSELNNKSDENDYLKVNQIKTIEYYKSNFYYWKKLPNFVGKNINSEKCTVYKCETENDRKPLNKEKNLKETNLYDDSYISFSKDKGYIFDQTVKAGKEYDSRDKADKKLLKVVGTEINYKGISGRKVEENIKKIMHKNAKIVFKGSADSSREVTKIVISTKNGKTDYFKNNEKITVEIFVEKAKQKTLDKKNSEKNKITKSISGVTAKKGTLKKKSGKSSTEDDKVKKGISERE